MEHLYNISFSHYSKITQKYSNIIFEYDSLVIFAGTSYKKIGIIGPTSGYRCLQVPTSGHRCLQVPQWAPVFARTTSGHRCLQVPTSGHRCLQVPLVCTGVCRYPPVGTGVCRYHQCVPVFAGTHQWEPVFAGTTSGNRCL